MDKPVILIAADSLTVRVCTALILQQQACTLAFAEDGLSALTAVADLSPALLILDTALKYLDGYSICQLLRKKTWYKDMPIILLTNSHTAVDRMRGHMVGATDYLTKPMHAEILIPIVQQYLTHWHISPLPSDLQPIAKSRHFWSSPRKVSFRP
jgi:DNA-binding response OmpR family regulator